MPGLTIILSVVCACSAIRVAAAKPRSSCSALKASTSMNAHKHLLGCSVRSMNCTIPSSNLAAEYRRWLSCRNSRPHSNQVSKHHTTSLPLPLGSTRVRDDAPRRVESILRVPCQTDRVVQSNHSIPDAHEHSPVPAKSPYLRNRAELLKVSRCTALPLFIRGNGFDSIAHDDDDAILYRRTVERHDPLRAKSKTGIVGRCARIDGHAC